MSWIEKETRRKFPRTAKGPAFRKGCGLSVPVVRRLSFKIGWWLKTSWFARSASITCGLTLASGSNIVLEPGSFEELDPDITAADPLDFRDLKRYRDRIRTYEKEGGKKKRLTSTAEARSRIFRLL